MRVFPFLEIFLERERERKSDLTLVGPHFVNESLTRLTEQRQFHPLPIPRFTVRSQIFILARIGRNVENKEKYIAMDDRGETWMKSARINEISFITSNRYNAYH